MTIIKFYKNDFHIGLNEVDTIRKTPKLKNTSRDFNNLIIDNTTFRITR